MSERLSYWAPKSLVVCVMRAMRPSRPSSTMATKMAIAAFSKRPFIACDHRVEAEEQRRSGEKVGQQVDAAAAAGRADAPRRRFLPALAVLCVLVAFVHALQPGFSLARIDSVAYTLSPSAAFTSASQRQVHVHARAEADEAVALTALERGARVDVAEDPARDQAGDLHAGDALPVAGFDPQGIPFVLQRRLVQRGVEERPGVVPALPHRTVHRRAVGVHVEDVHEYRDLQRIALEIGIAHLLHSHHAAVRRRQPPPADQRGSRAAGSRKELQDEQRDHPQRQRRREPVEIMDVQGRGNGDRQEQPALPSNQGVRVMRGHGGTLVPLFLHD